MANHEQISTIERQLAAWYDGDLTPGEAEALQRNIRRNRGFLPLALQRDAETFLRLADLGASVARPLPDHAPADLSKRLYGKYRPLSPRLKRVLWSTSAAAALILLVVGAISLSGPRPDTHGLRAGHGLASIRHASEQSERLTDYPNEVTDPGEALEVAAGALRLILDNIEAGGAALRDVNLEFAATSKSIEKSFK